MILAAVLSMWAERYEHRAIFNTSMLSDWPYKDLTEANAEDQRAAGIKMLDSIAANNFTTVYFHVRAMCDAYYESSYEPYAAGLAGARGKAPAFDPLAFIIDEGHKRGIEIYAWVNPFRYSNNPNKNSYGESQLNYETTHPEWLISNANQTILNPALPEARQRVIDVCTEIATKYDIDGIAFDDYFYPQGGMATDASADDYPQFSATGRPMSEYGDWRRENVNSFVAEFGKAIKAVKPWLRFGISPAGVCGTAKTSAGKYGVKPSPGSDWQYNQIYCDPLNWIVNGTVDFLSPQLYDHTGFGSVAMWYYYIAKKFDRHIYPAQSIVAYPNVEDFDQILDEIGLTRNYSTHHAPGYVFFPWINLFNASKTVNRVKVRLTSTLRTHLYTNKSWTPSMSWESWGNVPMPSQVAFDGSTLTWKGADNMRYIVYAFPKSLAKDKFEHQEYYIKAITYTESYTPDAETAADCNFAVATLDRYGHESSALMVGESLGKAPEVTLYRHTAGEKVQGFFHLRWTSDARRFVIEIARDKDFTQPVYSNMTTDKYIPSTLLPSIPDGTQLYWRVRAMEANCADTYSAVGNCEFARLQYTYPTATSGAVKLGDKFTWDAAEATIYNVKVSENIDMSDPVIDAEVMGGEYTLPETALVSGATYYAQLSVGSGDQIIESDPLPFTMEYIGASVPEFVTPAVDGATIFGDNAIVLNEQKGASQFRVEISASETFPPRSSGIYTLPAFTYATKNLSELTKPAFAQGTTYYVRARATYINETGGTITTDFTPTRKFVYGGESGVEDVSADAIRVEGRTLVIPTPQDVKMVEVYTAAGALVGTIDVKGTRTELNDLPQGVSLIKVVTAGGTKVIKMAR